MIFQETGISGRPDDGRSVTQLASVAHIALASKPS